MLRSYGGRFGWILFLVLCLSSVTAQADQSRHDSHNQFRYRYVSLDQYVPEGYTFSPVSIDDKGRVYGTASNVSAGDILGHIAIFDHKVLTIIQHGVEAYANTANERGTLGGGRVSGP